MGTKILVSAGEASGDLYTAMLVEALRRRHPDLGFFGCAGPRMQGVGVRPVVEAARLNVVGLVEVLAHIPHVYGEYRKLVDAARRERPRFAILTDSPDFHLRLARKLRRLGIPVVYLVAPQAWAWRKGRVRVLRDNVARLLCIFPFEEDFFRRHGVPAVYIGHPLTRLVRPLRSREEFFRRHSLPFGRPTLVLLPGSRPGEIARHLPRLADAALRLNARQACTFLLALPAGSKARLGEAFFREPIRRSSIQLIEGETWDAIAHAELALAASGTVTIEAAILGTPMVTFYRVNALSWWLGRPLVDVPYLSMVNLVGQEQIVPELMQNEMTGEKLAAAARRLLDDAAAREEMRHKLRRVAAQLAADQDPLERAAELADEFLH